MKLSALLASVAVAISGDAAIEAYCQTNFGKSISIYVNIDPKNPPSISKAPWVGLTVQGYNRPTEYNTKLVTFTLESAVFLNDATETTSGKITTLRGFASIEDLSDLVFAAIELAITTSATQTNMSYESEDTTTLTVAEFPGFMATRNFTIGKHV